MSKHMAGKVIVVTGAAGGFGRLVSEKSAALGARVVCADINEPGMRETLASIEAAGGAAICVRADVTKLDEMVALAASATERFGRIDVMVNNAGVMPLAFFADHEQAAAAWARCIDINIKGVMNGILAVYDQMIAQGRGHVVNLSSIYGNFPVAGAGVYGATKAAVNYLSESLRVESQGKIKVTLVKPTGVPMTGLAASVINMEAMVGILGQNAPGYLEKMFAFMGGELSPEHGDAENIKHFMLDPAPVADQIVYAINQPWGVSIGDITVRASGDGYIL